MAQRRECKMSDINLVNDSRSLEERSFPIKRGQKRGKKRNIVEYCTEHCNETTEGSVLAIGDGRRFREEQAY